MDHKQQQRRKDLDTCSKGNEMDANNQQQNVGYFGWLVIVGVGGCMLLLPFTTLLWMLFFASFIIAVAWHDRFAGTERSWLPKSNVVKSLGGLESNKHKHTHTRMNGQDASTHVSCADCGDENCSRTRPRVKRSQTHPWEFTSIPNLVDNDVAYFADQILKVYVNSWFDQISEDQEFQNTIKQELQRILSVVFLRFKQIDLKKLILSDVVDILRDHLQTCAIAHSIILNPTSSKTAVGIKVARTVGQKSNNNGDIKSIPANSHCPTVSLNTEMGVKAPFGIKKRLTEAQMKKLEHMVVLDSQHAHPATRTPEGVREYCRSLAFKLIPILCDAKTANSKLFHILLSNLLGSVVFQSLFALMADPTFIHGRILAIFEDEENEEKFFQQSPEHVQLLARFCNNGQVPSALTIPVHASSAETDDDASISKPSHGDDGSIPTNTNDKAHVAKGEVDSRDGKHNETGKKERSEEQESPKAIKNDALHSKVSALTTRLPDVLNNKDTLNAKFQAFLNENNAIEALIFVNDVDSMQNQVIQYRLKQTMGDHEGKPLSPKKKVQAIEDIHSLARNAYDSLGDLHRSDNGFLVDASIMQSIRKEIERVKDVGSNFDTFGSVTDPLVNTFKTAYDTVYQMLDSELFPDFLHSSHYFAAILHYHASTLTKKTKKHVRNASIGSTTKGSRTTSSSSSNSAQQKRERATTLLESNPIDAKEGRSMSVVASRSRTASFRDKELPSVDVDEEEVQETQQMENDGNDSDDLEEGNLEEKRIFSLEGITVRMKKPSLKGSLVGIKHYVYNMDVISKQPSPSGDDDKGNLHPVLGRNWTVSRRYKEFAQLDRILRAYFPDKMPLPEKKMLNNKGLKHIQERRKALSNYIEALLSNHLLQLDQRCCVAIYYFLENSSIFNKIARGSLKIHNILRMGKQSKSGSVDMDVFLSRFIVTNHDLDETKDTLLLTQTLLREQEMENTPGSSLPPPIIPVDDRAIGVALDVPDFFYSRICDIQRPCSFPSPVSGIIAMLRTMLSSSENKFASDMVFALVDDVLHSTINDVIEKVVDFQIHKMLCEGSMSENIAILCDVLFNEEYDGDVNVKTAKKMKEDAEGLIKDLLPDAVKMVFGRETCEAVTLSLVDYLCSPALNAQLVARVLDAAFEAMFPELKK
eukprot:m.112432 g.112432  ORF g.112432 m.112432 type:complete len:1153 (-) comp9255_c2_seq3:296-3754(-)